MAKNMQLSHYDGWPVFVPPPIRNLSLKNHYPPLKRYIISKKSLSTFEKVFWLKGTRFLFLSIFCFSSVWVDMFNNSNQERLLNEAIYEFKFWYNFLTFRPKNIYTQIYIFKQLVSSGIYYSFLSHNQYYILFF